MDGFAVALACARGLHLAGTASVFGIMVMTLLVEPVARAAPARQSHLGVRLRQVLLRSAAAAAVTGVAWAMLQAADMAGATRLGDAMAALPIALTSTRFGFALLLRLGLLAVIAATVASGHRRRARGWLTLLAAVALVAQSWMGHPAAAEDHWLLFASMLHVLAAGAWLGGLLPLYIVVDTVAGDGAARAAARFGWIGVVAVMVLATTATVQGWKLIGDEGGWFGTSYGGFAIIKLLLFAALLGLAAINRFKLTPAMQHGDRAAAVRHLRMSIIAEIVLGVLVVVAAATMATLAPGAHVQAEWPFPLRPNMALLDDADVRLAFIEAGILAAVALALAARAALFRRRRGLATVLAVAALWYGKTLVDDAPFLDPILIDATATSYYHSPSGFTAASIADGARLFAANCTACHGTEGRGDGPAAANLPVKPADLTAEHVLAHSDGEMFWWLSAGIPTRAGAPLMPAFRDILSDDDRWALIDYIHAHLAGAALARTAVLSFPVAPPALQAECANGQSVNLDDLRGQFIRIIAMPANPQAVAASVATTLLISRTPTEADKCVAAGEDVWQAFAIFAGVAPDLLAGSEFLVDPNGWLRARVLPAEATAWSQPGVLAALAKEIAAHPLQAGAGVHHHH